MHKGTEMVLLTLLFATLSAFTWTPVFGELFISAGFVLIVLCLYRHGVWNALLIGLLGMSLACFFASGSADWVSWLVATLAFITIEGSVVKITEKEDPVIFLSINMISCCFAGLFSFILVKSKIDTLAFGGVMADYIMHNTYAFVGTTFVTLLGIPLCHLTDLKNTRKRVEEEWEKQ